MRWFRGLGKAGEVATYAAQTAAEAQELQRLPKAPVPSQPLTDEQRSELKRIANRLVDALPFGYKKTAGRTTYKVTSRTSDSLQGQSMCISIYSGNDLDLGAIGPEHKASDEALRLFRQHAPELVLDAIDYLADHSRNETARAAVYCLEQLGVSDMTPVSPDERLLTLLDEDHVGNGSFTMNDLVEAMDLMSTISKTNSELITRAKREFGVAAQIAADAGVTSFYDGADRYDVRSDAYTYAGRGGVGVYKNGRPGKHVDLLNPDRARDQDDFLIVASRSLIGQVVEAISDRPVSPRLQGIEAAPNTPSSPAPRPPSQGELSL